MNGYSIRSGFGFPAVLLTVLLAGVLTACAPGAEDTAGSEAMADEHPGDHAHDERSEPVQAKIAPAMAEKFELETELSGPADITETVRLFGQVLEDETRSLNVQARFPGLIRSVQVQVGDRVAAGASLATVESDESLKSYTLAAPADGIVVSRQANPGEQTGGRTLFRIVDPSRVWVEFRVFPSQQQKVVVGQNARIADTSGAVIAEGEIDWIDIETRSDQSIGARVTLPNPTGRLIPGMHLTSDVAVAVHNTPITVLRTGLQTFRDATVVFSQTGEIYEPRVVTLGRQDADRVEVRSGLQAGERYVSRNSYLIKADIEKDSAAHEH